MVKTEFIELYEELNKLNEDYRDIYHFFYDFEDDNVYDYIVEEWGVIETLVEILSEKPEFKEKSEEEIENYIKETGVQKLADEYETELTDAFEDNARDEFEEENI